MAEEIARARHGNNSAERLMIKRRFIDDMFVESYTRRRTKIRSRDAPKGDVIYRMYTMMVNAHSRAAPYTYRRYTVSRDAARMDMGPENRRTQWEYRLPGRRIGQMSSQ